MTAKKKAQQPIVPKKDEHELLVEAARDAISAVFGDTRVSPDKTRESLEELKTEIQDSLNTLDSDDDDEDEDDDAWEDNYDEDDEDEEEVD